jgi:hypothetical protein
MLVLLRGGVGFDCFHDFLVLVLKNGSILRHGKAAGGDGKV